MDRATADFYEPLLTRDLDAIPSAIRRYLGAHDERELWTTIARFAVLAFVPSLHSIRALMAARAVWSLRDSPQWRELLAACAAYAASVRPGWSEPPIFERRPDAPPTEALLEAVRNGDRAAATAWLAGHVDDAREVLRGIVRGEALLTFDTALALEPLLGAPGRHALLHAVVLSLFADASEPAPPIGELVARAVATRGSIDAVRDVFVGVARDASSSDQNRTTIPPLEPYPLARDFAHALIVRGFVPRLPPDVDVAPLLAAVDENLQHGDDYGDWSG